MIAYSKGCRRGIFKWRTWRQMLSMQFVRSALLSSFIFSFIAAFCNYYSIHADEDYNERWMPDAGLYKAFTSFVGFLIVFRTSTSIQRFFSGAEFCLTFTGMWFNATSSLFSFCRGSNAFSKDVQVFQHTFVRLVSLLVALSLTELSGNPESGDVFELIDVRGIDKTTLETIQDSDCRVETVYQLIQAIVTANISRGVLAMPPPIISGAFKEMGNAMIRFHEAVRFEYFPMPYPYVVVTEIMLLLYGFFSAAIIGAAWSNDPLQAFCCTFVMVFIFNFLCGLSFELDNPFGHDGNDIDVADIHSDMNKRLIALLRIPDEATPTLDSKAELDAEVLHAQASAELLKTTVKPGMTCLEDLGSCLRTDQTQEQSMLIVLMPSERKGRNRTRRLSKLLSVGSTQAGHANSAFDNVASIRAVVSSMQPAPSVASKPIGQVVHQVPSEQRHLACVVEVPSPENVSAEGNDATANGATFNPSLWWCDYTFDSPAQPKCPRHGFWSESVLPCTKADINHRQSTDVDVEKPGADNLEDLSNQDVRFVRSRSIEKIQGRIEIGHMHG